MGSDLQLVNDDQVIRAIDRNLTRSRLVEPLKSDAGVRSSAIPKLCPREEVLVAVHRRKRTDLVDSDLRLTFVHGTGLHHALQNIVLPMCGDLFWGMWRCGSCAALHQAGRVLKAEESWNRHEDPPSGWKRLDQGDWKTTIRLRPSKCENCGATVNEHEGEALFTYEEYTFHDDVMNIGGHNDGFLKIADLPGFGILEAKSIGTLWQVKKAPLLDHIIQANMYMHFTGCAWAIILYWHKGSPGISAFVQHVIARDDEMIEECKQVFATMRATLRKVEDIDARDLPDLDRSKVVHAEIQLPDRICNVRDCERANGCSVVAECFG